MHNKSSVPIFKESWFQGILAFFAVQLVFIFMELTGWIPKVKDYDGNVLGNLIDMLNINDWAL